MLLVLLAAAGGGWAQTAQPRTPIARLIDPRVVQENERPVFSVQEVEAALDHIAIARGVPSPAWLQGHCQVAVRNILKAPATARFTPSSRVYYSLSGSVYSITGSVDAQNSYGALLRERYHCSAVFRGDASGGYVTFRVELF